VKNLFLIPIFYFLFFKTSSAQNPGNNRFQNSKDSKMGRIYGKVIDFSSGLPVEYASVQVLSNTKDSLLGGSLVKANGDFSIDGLPSFGLVRVKVLFIGYKESVQKVFISPPEKLEVDIGDIKLAVDETVTKEVEVVAEKSNVNLGIDKRVYNVDKDLSVRGGTAADVMKNVPGVTVDADGNAQLRNQSPTIFVDGRPTQLTLMQIPADQIERVEIITNPSVKYDASASGGILNVIMKKNTKPGYNGMLSTYIGTGDRYGGTANLNLKNKRWNYSFMYNYNQGINNNKGFTRRTQLDVITENPLGYFNQDNIARLFNRMNTVKISADYTINNRNTITLSENITAGEYKTLDKQNYVLLDANKTETANGNRINNQLARFVNYLTQIHFQKTFPKVGKELTTDLNYSYNNSKNHYLYTTYAPHNNGIQIGNNQYQKNDGGSFANQFNFQMDYVNPITETKKIELGIKSYYKNSDSKANTSNASVTEDSYLRDSLLSNHYKIDDIINAAYFNYSSKIIWDIEFQGGLRFEQSYYSGKIVDQNLSFSYKYPSGNSDILKSLFPAIYFSKKLKNNQEMQFNVSRKIQRPNFYQLMPFILSADNQNRRIGNPQLKPEFKNIAEVNYNKRFKVGSYLFSGYVRYEEQPITEIAYYSPIPGESTILINTAINGNNSIRYGIENTLKLTIFKNLDLMTNVNSFYIYIKGAVVENAPEVKAEGYVFNGKATLSYKLPKNVTFQVNGNYESRKVLLLGYLKPIYSIDVSLNYILKTKWIFNASLNDIFNSRINAYHYETPSYFQDLSRRRETRFFRVNVSYIFGKTDANIFKRGKQNKNSGQDSNQEGGFY